MINKTKNQTTVRAWPCVRPPKSQSTTTTYIQPSPSIRPPRQENPNNKGITLIALVITIIVLLILAGVALSLVMGNDGILGRAESAVKQTDIAGAKEQVELLDAKYIADYYQAKYVNQETLGTAKDYVISKIGSGTSAEGYYVTTDENGKITIYKGSDESGEIQTTGYIKDDGSIDWGSKWEYGTDEEGNTTITDGTQTLKIGDYVNYDPKDGATTTSVTSYGTDNGYGDQKFNLSSYDYGWRVLGVDENTGGILLLAEEFIGPDEGGYFNTTYNRTYYYLQGQAGYANGINELNKICSMYGQGKYATGGRSITVEDVNKITGYNPETAGYGAGQINEYGNKVTYSSNGTGTIYYSGTNGVSGSDPQNTFNWFDEEARTWKSLSSTDTGRVVLTSTCYGYAPDTLSTDQVDSVSGLSYYTTAGELLFGKHAIDSNTGVRVFTGRDDEPSFWLASTYVGMREYAYADFGFFGVRYGHVDGWITYDSRGYAMNPYSGCRAVVALVSDIELIYRDGKKEWDIAE